MHPMGFLSEPAHKAPTYITGVEFERASLWLEDCTPCAKQSEKALGPIGVHSMIE